MVDLGTPPRPADSTEPLLQRFGGVRAQTEALAKPFSPEDLNLQPMRDTSPGKWHLAHTSWFFDTFLLERFDPQYAPFDPAFRSLFNSYYNSLGAQPARDQRTLGQPSLPEVLSYRAFVTDGVHRLWQRLRHRLSDQERAEVARTLELGIQHEQQHQELLLTDLKFALAPRAPREAPLRSARSTAPAPLTFLAQEAGLVEIGARDGAGFSFDIERPRHRVYLERHAIASRLVTNREYQAFIDDGGYAEPLLWLAEGFETAQRERWTAPLYWQREGEDEVWTTVSHNGERVLLDPHAPVAHVSYFEAEAYARWARARLPTEAEWEHAATALPISGNFLASGAFAPRAATGAPGMLDQMFGDTWEWTQSAYLPYPRFRALDGALAEYNGKFMVNQMVLRGGSAFSPRSHLRASYRNFFPAATRWQLSGIRLARDLDSSRD